MSTVTTKLSLVVLATLPFTLTCSNNTCHPIPDGVYAAIDPDGGPLFTAAAAPAAAPLTYALETLSDGATSDAISDASTVADAATAVDAATHDAAGARDATTDAAITRDASTPRDAAPTTTDAGPRDAAAGRDAGVDLARDAATGRDAAVGRDAATPRDAAVDAGAVTDAATNRDAGVGAAVEIPVTYTFHDGLPAPYDTWNCERSTLSCEMTYICRQGDETVSIITSYSPGILAFSVTPPGTTVRLQWR